jgi:hypothetical protein
MSHQEQKEKNACEARDLWPNLACEVINGLNGQFHFLTRRQTRRKED